VRSYAIPEPKAAPAPSCLLRHAGDSRCGLIDTRLVRVELARLRAPRATVTVAVAPNTSSTAFGDA
jgi:hypothetical protein